MEITRDDRLRMERAHVRAWPALRSALVDGWLWRSSGGGSQRANSVSTIDFTGTDLAASLDAVEARYRACGAAPRFQSFDDSAPAGLVEALQARGYRQADPTITMFRPAAPAPERPANGLALAIEAAEIASPAWRDVYLNEISPDRRQSNSQILAGIPAPRAFFAGHRDGAVVCTALCVVSFGCAVIECVATRSDARRKGAARQTLDALLAWARKQGVNWIGLQVAASNAPAIRLYERLGFVPGATNRFWVLPADPG